MAIGGGFGCRLYVGAVFDSVVRVNLVLRAC
jgi:hypothetical protein